MSEVSSPVLTIDLVDYHDPRDAHDLVRLLDAYARDPMGGGESLGEEVCAILPARLAEVPGAFSLIARLDEEAIGIANCFFQFSTFMARPVVNIHDLAVLDGHRGHGVGRAMLDRIEWESRDRGACKITLEVLSGNNGAKHLYKSLGYGEYVLDPKAGQALFWQKKL